METLSWYMETYHYTIIWKPKVSPGKPHPPHPDGSTFAVSMAPVAVSDTVEGPHSTDGWGAEGLKGRCGTMARSLKTTLGGLVIFEKWCWYIWYIYYNIYIYMSDRCWYNRCDLDLDHFGSLFQASILKGWLLHLAGYAFIRALAVPVGRCKLKAVTAASG